MVKQNVSSRLKTSLQRVLLAIQWLKQNWRSSMNVFQVRIVFCRHHYQYNFNFSHLLQSAGTESTTRFSKNATTTSTKVYFRIVFNSSFQKDKMIILDTNPNPISSGGLLVLESIIRPVDVVSVPALICFIRYIFIIEIYRFSSLNHIWP